MRELLALGEFQLLSKSKGFSGWIIFSMWYCEELILHCMLLLGNIEVFRVVRHLKRVNLLL